MKCYICNCCGEVVDDLKEVREFMGYYGSAPAYDSDYVCPYCGSDDLDEAEECECCGEYHRVDELTNGVCDDCLHSHDKDWKFWYESCRKEEYVDKIDLNLFLCTQFSKEQIEEILYKELCKREKLQPEGIDCSDFVEGDGDIAAALTVVFKDDEDN